MTTRRGFLVGLLKSAGVAGAAAAAPSLLLRERDPEYFDWLLRGRPRSWLGAGLVRPHGTVPYPLSNGEVLWLWADGEHDDAPVIQRALDAEGLVTLPSPHRYALRGTIDLRPGAVLDGGNRNDARTRVVTPLQLNCPPGDQPGALVRNLTVNLADYRRTADTVPLTVTDAETTSGGQDHDRHA